MSECTAPQSAPEADAQRPSLSDRAEELGQAAVDVRARYGYNCAQAVACTLAPELGADPGAVYRLSEALGAGMGGHNETCGAITGALLMLGQVASGGVEEPGTTKFKTYRLSKALVDGFRDKNGSTNCGELKGIQCDHGMLRSCEGCIEDAVLLACNVIDRWRAEQR